MKTPIPSLPSSPCKSGHPFLPNSQKKTLFITNFIDVRNFIHVYSEAPPMPGLPLPPTTRKTLFLDLDDTLIRQVELPDQYDFATKTHYIIKRPGVEKLLQVATDNDFEIVIFTAGGRDYASPIIDWLDPNVLITHRLYRDSCKRNIRGIPIKDLTLTGRSLDRCIIIDDLWQRVPQRENVVMIKPFKGGTQDSELTRLLRFFEIESRYEDLRDAVSHVNESFESLMEMEIMMKTLIEEINCC
ncbi:carboxy-terminal domain RNA polymerase II polypeptide A small phosphatase 2-like protein [Carex littledalei]|uniref:Mitochondrial import inner membrane translocase subunit TIM50 n=1 Tax=Carex littledalei TaxID=544730 RepID=A0A833RHE9_9POAL|nr:carboxy-terminal domain RNA polymerase II polypeptide A small phosphatase 2-like protein [Carex littledalei]